MQEKCLLVSRRITRGGRGEVSPALFRKLEKSALILGGKCPNFSHLWVNFLIYSAIFKSFQEKNPEIFSQEGLSFSCVSFSSSFFLIVYQSALTPRKLPYPKKFLVAHQGVLCLLMLIIFRILKKHCLFYVSLSLL